MAFEAMYRFPEVIKRKILLYEKTKKKALDEDDVYRYIKYGSLQAELYDCLLIYRATALKQGRFIDQRSKCDQIINEIKKILS